MISVCVSSDSTNHPVWNKGGFVQAPNANSNDIPRPGQLDFRLHHIWEIGRRIPLTVNRYRRFSPGTSSSIGTSRTCSVSPVRRRTVAVVRTIARSLAAALFERCSCPKARETLNSTITAITAAARLSPRECCERQQQEIEWVLGAPDQFLDEALLPLVSKQVRPVLEEPLRCHFGGQTLGCRAELFQQPLGLRSRCVDQPLCDGSVAMAKRRQTPKASPP
jgi:hypothetical protein